MKTDEELGVHGVAEDKSWFGDWEDRPYFLLGSMRRTKMILSIIFAVFLVLLIGLVIFR